MAGIRTLHVQDFRCLREVRVDANADCNLIIGANASGKTSLLETLFLLGRGRSFRTPHLQAAVRHGAEAFTIAAGITTERGDIAMGVRNEGGRLVGRLAGEPVQTLAALAQELPVQIIDARVHELIEGGPGARRRFLDWGLFHVEPQFLDTWRRYRRALRQRNALLKRRSAARDLAAWDGELVTQGERLDDQRRRYVDRLAAVLPLSLGPLLELDVDVGYLSGWRSGIRLGEALAASADRDRAGGVTHVGPHRADLRVLIEGASARERASRGQQKLLAAGLLLGQIRLLSATSVRRIVLLVDDPAAELDQLRLSALLEQIRQSPTQRFITGLSPGALAMITDAKKFHVEQGDVAEMI